MEDNIYFENIILGSGPSAVAAAKELKRLGKDFAILDVGFDLPEATTSKIQQLRMAHEWPSNIVSELFPIPKVGTDGVERRFPFGSDFTYKAPTQDIELSCSKCSVDITYAKGGFGNIWGGAVLPFSSGDILDWPADVVKDLQIAYATVLDYMPIVGEDDFMQSEFFISPQHLKDKKMPISMHFLNNFFAKKISKNFVVGRARLAVSVEGKKFCRSCGYCLDGCVYGSIFNPRDIICEEFEGQGKYHAGEFVLALREETSIVSIKTVNVITGKESVFRAARVFVGIGAINTTRLIAKALEVKSDSIPIMDAQYFFFPVFLTQRKSNLNKGFTLADLFVEIRDGWSQNLWTHFQVYSFNRLFEAAIVSKLGKIYGLIKRQVQDRFILFQGFMHSKNSDMLMLKVGSDGDEILGQTSWKTNYRMLRSCWAIQRKLGLRGLVFFPLLKKVPPGRSFHVGASFPMQSVPKGKFYSDILGRPNGLKRIHAIDGSVFASIPATTYAYTLMANATRIIRGVFSEK